MAAGRGGRAATLVPDRGGSLQGLGRIMVRVLGGAFALMLALALGTYHPLDPHLFAEGAVGGSVHNL